MDLNEQPTPKSMLDNIHSWFTSLPPHQQEQLASFFIMLTSENAHIYAKTNKEKLDQFILWLEIDDLEFRKIMKVLTLCAFLDFFLPNMSNLKHPFQDDQPKITYDFLEAQWSKTATTWSNLRAEKLTYDSLVAAMENSSW